MGMAYQAPATRREFRYQISKHAVDRFRERVEEEFSARDDIDLSRLLDERLRHAIEGGNYTEIVDASSPNGCARAVRIESRNGTSQYAVLRPCSSAPGGFAAVTVLSEAQGRTNFTNGVWKPANRPFAEALRNVKVVAPVPAVEPAPQPTAAAPAQPEPEEQRKLPAGWRSFEQTQRRLDFVRKTLRERPRIKWTGDDGLSELLVRTFGVGISHEVFCRVRDEVLGQQAMEATSPPAAPVPRLAMPDIAPPVASVVIELTSAIEAERLAKERYTRAQSEMWAAETELKRCSEHTESLMRKLQQERGS